MLLTTKRRQKIYAPYLQKLEGSRKKNDVSQSQLARDTGLSSKYVTLIESGKRLPSLECFIALLAQAGIGRRVALDLVTEVINQFTWQRER